jgi:hypothetical protein
MYHRVSFLTENGRIKQISRYFCLGHWNSVDIDINSITPQLIEFKDLEIKRLSFITTIVARDQNSQYEENYFFYCYDITHGPSKTVKLLKVNPRIAARILGGFLNDQYHQSLTRKGNDYYPGPPNMANAASYYLDLLE